ncbi:MAG: polysaccharide deacetylase family protein [Candidatus Metalachnospira sp.]|nr:polysaccharide deacetylase family protein [Candidatus Metalachnospira sp.]
MGKIVTFSFDDGRSNNYEAAEILSSYGYQGTFHITTGYVDGTWKSPTGWKSAGTPLSIEQVISLRNQGHEISLHGDKHLTEKEDFSVAYSKLEQWGVIKKCEHIGFSLPNSQVDKFVLSTFIQSLKDSPLLYIRCGRHPNSTSFYKKIFYAIYRVSGNALAYQIFNSQNYNDLNVINRFSLYSVVVKASDTPGNLIKYTANLPDNSYVIFMMHSILNNTDSLYGSDSWYWDKKNLIQICNMIQNDDNISVKTIAQTIRLMSED